jgi:sulfate permease, SulP family
MDTSPAPRPPRRRGDAVVGWRLLRRYERGWFRPDLIAGLTVGAMLVPQSMAYAELAGVPPQVGLYAVVLAPVVYALVGTSRHLGTGPEPGTAILAGTGVGAIVGAGGDTGRYLALMAALALLVAGIAAVARVLRLGFVASLLSRPVLVGYITGVGLVLVSSQLRSFTGVPVEAGEFFPRFGEFLTRLGQAQGITVTVGVAALATILLLRRHAPRLPGALIAVGGATIVSTVLDLAGRGDPTVGAIPAGLPVPGLPDIGWGDLTALLPVALGITLVGYTDNMLTARSIGARMGYRIDADQEFAGLAVANLASGLFQGMPVSSSASRTAVPAALGSVTTLVSIIASGFVVVTLLFARGILGAVPRAALAAVILAAAVAIIDVDGFRDLWHLSRTEFVLAAVTALGVMVFDVLVGVLVAVALSVTVALARMARPADAVLGARADLDGWVAVDQHPAARTLPGLLVYRFDAPLFFINAERFRTRLTILLEENPGSEEWVVLDFEGIGEIDATAIDALRELIDELGADEVAVIAVARANERTLARLRRGDLLTPTGPLVSFPTINAAVTAFEERAPQEP